MGRLGFRRAARSSQAVAVDLVARSVVAQNQDDHPIPPANDCRRLCGRHALTPEVFEEVLQSISEGNAPGAEDLAQFRSAAEATRSVLQRLDHALSLLEQIIAESEAGA